MSEYIGIREFPWSGIAGNTQYLELSSFTKEPNLWQLLDDYYSLDLPFELFLRASDNVGELYSRGDSFSNCSREFINYSLPVPVLRHKNLEFKLRIFSCENKKLKIISNELCFDNKNVIYSQMAKLLGREDLYDTDFYFLKQWTNFFDSLAETQQQGKLFFSNLASEIRNFSGGNDAQMSLIVTISEVFNRKLHGLVFSMRNALARQRKLLPLERANEVDSKCIQWLFNQPGNSIKDKIAFNNCKIMAISRYQNCNLLENRVLKEFIIRSQKEASLYLKKVDTAKKYKEQKSTRERQVSNFKALCNELLNTPELLPISRQLTMPTPNYVLLNDIRYKAVWHYFVKLLKQEQEKDRYWAYQKRTFEDVSLILLQASFVEKVEQKDFQNLLVKPIADGIPIIYKELLNGRRASHESVAGPFILIKGNRHFILEFIGNISSENQIYKKKTYAELSGLGICGSDSFILIKELNAKKSTLICIYSLHCPYDNYDKYSSEDIINSANEAYRNANATLKIQDSFNRKYEYRALVMRSSFVEKNLNTFFEEFCSYIETPVDPHFWFKTIDELKVVWDLLLEEATK